MTNDKCPLCGGGPKFFNPACRLPVELWPAVQSLKDDAERQRRIVDNYVAEVLQLRARVAELEGRVYGERELWRDECDFDAREAAHAEADLHGQPVHVNVHGTRRYTARPKRIAELESENARLQAELAAVKYELGGMRILYEMDHPTIEADDDP